MSLPNLKDDQIIQAIKTRFESIVAGSDYNYDFEKVYDNLPSVAAIEADKLRVINLRETNEALDGAREQANDTIHDIRFAVFIDLIGRGYSPTEIRKMKSDIYKSIGQDLTWGGLAFHTEFISARRNGRDAYENIISDWTIEIDIIFRKLAWSTQWSYSTPSALPVDPMERPYKVYSALLSQTGTNAPVATVLENTLGGDVVWTRINPGQYLGTLINTFFEFKTIGYCIATYGVAVAARRSDDDAIILMTSTITANLTNGVLIITPSDSLLYLEAPIEIRVYD